MDRRQLLKNTLFAAGLGKMTAADAETIFVNAEVGTDTNQGAKLTPLKNLEAAVRRINESDATGPATIVLAEGVYALDRTVLIRPKRQFTRAARLTIRAQSLPDDPDWSPARMPMLVHTMPLSPNWLGQPDRFGGVAYGIQVETSHVTIQGLKMFGSPHLEEPAAGLIRRVYPIAREGLLDDLEIRQCVFAGDPNSVALHCGVLARGNGVVVDHCIFHRCKITVVYWTGKATGCAMRHTIATGNYGTACWVCATGDDFDFRNNVISDNHCGWLFQGPVGQYKPADSLFAGNRHLFGAGLGPPIDFKPLGRNVLELPKSVRVQYTPVRLQFEQTRREYLHVARGTAGAEIHAGLFMK